MEAQKEEKKPARVGATSIILLVAAVLPMVLAHFALKDKAYIIVNFVSAGFLVPFLGKTSGWKDQRLAWALGVVLMVVAILLLPQAPHLPAPPA